MKVIILLILTQTFVFGQNLIPAFYVFSIKGKTYLKSKEDKNLLKTLQVIHQNDKIILESNSLLTLVDFYNGIPIDLKTEGTFLSSELVKQTSGLKDPMLLGLSQEILKSLKNSKNENLILNQADEIESRAPITSYYPVRSANTFLNQSVFIWKKMSDVYRYHFIVQNQNNETVFDAYTEDSFYVANFSKLGLKSNETYFWQVIDSDYRLSFSPPKGFKILSETNEKLIASELSILDKKLFNLESSYKFLLLAKYFERNNLNTFAYLNYQNAVIASNYSPEYIFLFNQFLNYHK